MGISRKALCTFSPIRVLGSLLCSIALQSNHIDWPMTECLNTRGTFTATSPNPVEVKSTSKEAQGSRQFLYFVVMEAHIHELLLL